MTWTTLGNSRGNVVARKRHFRACHCCMRHGGDLCEREEPRRSRIVKRGKYIQQGLYNRKNRRREGNCEAVLLPLFLSLNSQDAMSILDAICVNKTCKPHKHMLFKWRCSICYFTNSNVCKQRFVKNKTVDFSDSGEYHAGTKTYSSVCIIQKFTHSNE